MDDWKKKPLSSSGGGYKPLHEEERLKKPVERVETTRERAARHRRERQEELTFTQEDYTRYERNRQRVLAERGELGKRDRSHIDFFLKKKRTLDVEVQKATEELLIFLPTLNLESSIHSQAVKEFSEAFDVILKGYNGSKISYETGYDLIHQIKNGFIEGGGALKKIEENRLLRHTEKTENFTSDGAYRRNMIVNNESFNIRFKASCATPECLMRNANIDMEDDAFQDYIEAATQDKRSDVMQVIGVALIANPYLKPLEYIALGDMAYSASHGDFDSSLAYGMGKGAYYRLHLLNVSKRVRLSAENATSYFSGRVLSSD